MNRKLTSLLLSAAVLLLAGCSREAQNGPAGQPVEVSVIFSDTDLQITKAFGNTHNVDRILLLPLFKVDASGADTPANFAPEYSLAKQVDVASFPATVSLSLLGGADYKVVAIGYNHADYDHANPAAAGTRFTIGSSATPATLANMQLVPASPFSVPELFSCMCTASGNETFVAEEGLALAGELKRIVSGLSLSITNIPASVTSIELRADRLTTAAAPAGGSATLWQTADATDTNLLATQTPASGGASFDVLLLPTGAGQAVKFYLDVTDNGTEERFAIKVNDVAGVASGNAITFKPNGGVSITGDYTDINIGFIITGSLNLDDDLWDGL